MNKNLAAEFESLLKFLAVGSLPRDFAAVDTGLFFVSGVGMAGKSTLLDNWANRASGGQLFTKYPNPRSLPASVEFKSTSGQVCSLFSFGESDYKTTFATGFAALRAKLTAASEELVLVDSLRLLALYTATSEQGKENEKVERGKGDFLKPSNQIWPSGITADLVHQLSALDELAISRDNVVVAAFNPLGSMGERLDNIVRDSATGAIFLGQPSVFTCRLNDYDQRRFLSNQKPDLGPVGNSEFLDDWRSRAAEDTLKDISEGG